MCVKGMARVCERDGEGVCVRERDYLTQSVFEVVSQKSVPTPIRQLILYISNSKGQVDGFVGKVDFCKMTL